MSKKVFVWREGCIKPRGSNVCEDGNTTDGEWKQGGWWMTCQHPT
jgi:hypothetical protein